MAKKTVSKKTAARAGKPAAVGKKAPARKKSGSATNAPGTRLMTTAATVGRALGRAANGVDKLKAVVTRKAAPKRGKKKARKDPAKEAERARTRALWKSQERASTAVELAQQGTLVDERARVRSVTGMSWSNRKPR